MKSILNFLLWERNDSLFNANSIFTLILCLLDSLLFVFLLNHFKVDNTKKWLTDLILVVIMTALIFCLTIFGIIPHIKIIILSIAMFISTYLYSLKWEHRFILVVFYNFIVISIELIIVSFVIKTLNISFNNFSINYTDSIFLLVLISKFFIFIGMVLFARALIPNNIILPLKINALFVGILSISIISMILLFYSSLMVESQAVATIMFFICLLIILIAIGVFYLYSSLNKYNSKIQKEGVKRVYNKLNERYLEKNQLQNKLLSEMWHDMNNHINTLKLMSASKNNDSIDYLHSIENKIKQIPNTIKTGNNLADIIFNEKYSEAFLHNIDFDVKSVLPPILSIDNTDFSSLLFNTIDNAIEANMNVENDNKYIYIEMYPKGNFLYYKIKNSYNPEINKTNPKKFFRKKDYITPGYGMSIVNDIVYKSNGNIKIDKTDNEFTVTIIINTNI